MSVIIPEGKQQKRKPNKRPYFVHAYTIPEKMHKIKKYDICRSSLFGWNRGIKPCM